MLVELNLLRNLRIQHGQTGAAVVHQHILEVPEDAFEDRHVDMLAIQIGVAFVVPVVTGLQNHVDGEPKRVEQIHERLEDLIAVHRGHQHRHVVVVLLVAVVVVPISFTGHDL